MSPGLRFGSYRKLCEYLGEPYKSGGNSKAAQINEWTRFFDYHQEGRAWIIDEVFKIPHEKEDKRSSGNRSIYIRDIEILILNILYRQDEDRYGKVEYWATATRLMKEMGMVNELYHNQDAESKLPELDSRITPYQLKEFYCRASGNIGNIIKNALNGLSKQKLITCEKRWLAIRDGKAWKVPRRYDVDLTNCEYHVLQDHGYETVYPFFIQGKMDKFYSERTDKIKEELFPDIESIYEVYRIRAVKESVRNGIEQNLARRRKLVEDTKRDLNQKVINRMHEEVRDKINNYKFFEHFNEDYFISTQDSICSFLVDLDMNVRRLDFMIQEKQQKRDKIWSSDDQNLPFIN